MPSFLNVKCNSCFGRGFYLKVIDYGYIPNQINIFENKNEFIFTFSANKDLTGLLSSTRRRLPVQPDDAIDPDDMVVSFKQPDGSIDWDLFNQYVNDNPKQYIKAKSSIYRAKNTIYDLIQSNWWDYFVTLTVNPSSKLLQNVDIKNVKDVQYIFARYIQKLNRYSDSKIKYVLIPEYQQNGNVHFHGVMSGIDKEDLDKAINNQEYRRNESGEIMTDDNGNPIVNEYYKQPLIRNGNQVFNHIGFNEFGYNDFEIIRDMARVGSYCTKYITKDLFDRADEYGSHLYICSKGLERKRKVYTRDVETFRKLSVDEIKTNLSDDAYIINTDYCTKVIINKSKIKDVQQLIDFAEKVAGDHLPEHEDKLSDDIKKSDFIYRVAQHSNPDRLRSIGIKRYDRNTGEVVLMPSKKPDPDWIQITLFGHD